MIPKEFTKTYKLQKELTSLEEDEEKAIFKAENPEIAHYVDNEYLEHQKELHESDTQERYKKKIADSFTKEYKKLNKSNTYFLGCSLNNYKYNYNRRLTEFKAKFIDAIEHNFIFEEFQNINKFSLPYYIGNDFKRNVNFSIERTKEHLKERLNEIGYEFKTSYNNAGEINTLAIKGFSVLNINEEPTIDLSDSKGTEKIIYLELIGFFEYIKNREPHLSNNKIASLISGFTGLKQKTVQPYINPILNTGIEQDKNPLRIKKNVDIIKNKLIELNFKNIKSG